MSLNTQDVVRGQRDHLGVHNTGNVVLKTSQHGDGYIVVDGQQRITTTMLLLAALRYVKSGVGGGHHRRYIVEMKS